MKTLLVASALTLLSLSPLAAQGLVTAGKIQSFSKETGTLTLIPESRATTPMVFLHMDRAPILFVSGKTGNIRDLEAGRGASIHYTAAGKRLVVSKIVLSAAISRTTPVPAVVLPRGERRALRSPAANDRDITTQPGSKARIDRDITTQPGQKDALTRDITKKAPGNANRDRDITTSQDRR